MPTHPVNNSDPLLGAGDTPIDKDPSLVAAAGVHHPDPPFRITLPIPQLPGVLLAADP